ncbi:uncharacterized protein LOC121680512 [Alosa sapidissima]|uniref:uncharacterized protein LOC121680512 n=1 Tax=Alosa sapidissima TaxID=34773 RepID=UPI001C0915A1|nr:uncharacterized protein LOC121680512 [Alosa sapidissima]
MVDSILKFTDDSGQMSTVYWPQGKRTTIPAQSEVVLEACARPRPDGKDYVGLVEPIQENGLPGQLLLARSLSTVANGRVMSKVHYLGHVITEGGVSPDPGKLQAVEAWPAPKNITQLRAFLGLAGYYRRFIKDFASLAAPLNSLLWGTSKRRTQAGSDNNPLAHLNTANLGAVEQRWLAQLAGFQFGVRYRPGRMNGNADALSRWPTDYTVNGEEQETAAPADGLVSVKPEVVQACMHAFVPERGELKEDLSAGTPVQMERGDWLGPSLLLDWRRAQRADPDVSWLWLYQDRGKAPSPKERAAEGRGTQALLREWDRLCQERGLLCRGIWDAKTFEKVKQVVVPQCLQKQVLEWLHDQAGHLGAEKVLGLVRRRFFWRGVAMDVKEYCAKCMRCNLHKTPSTKVSAPLVSIQTSYPLQFVSVDFLSLEAARSGMSNVLVIVDHFTRYAVAAPTVDQTAATTAEVLWKHFIQPYGGFDQLHSDQGPNFESSVIKELCTFQGLEHVGMAVANPDVNKDNNWCMYPFV